MTEPLRAPGNYSICPLCDEHLRHPDVDENVWGGTIDETVRLRIAAHHNALEAMLMDHMRIHTARIVLAGD